MTNKELMNEYDKSHIQTIKEMIKVGQINPFMHIIAKEPGEEKAVILHIDIPATNDMTKELFARHGIPSLKEDLKKSGMELLFVTFTSESWIRKVKVEKEGDPIPDNWRDEVPDEVVMVAYSSAEGESIHVYDIIRDEYAINDNGDLVEKVYESDKDGNLYKKVEMVYNEELSGDDGEYGGSYSNLYNQLT